MRTTVPAVLLAGALLAAACDERLSDLTGPTRDLEPSFSSIQRDIFQAPDSSGRPACTSCHNAVGSRFNGLDLTGDMAHGNLVNRASVGRPGAVRVVPGDPENSYIIHKLEGRSTIAGVRMPLGGPYLTDGQILVIKRWIERGAPND